MEIINIDGIEVELVRRRVRRVNLRVRRDGSTVASAPATVSRRELERFVRANLSWVRQVRERRLAALQAERGRWREGGCVRDFGRELTLSVACDAPSRSRSWCSREKATLMVHVMAPTVPNDLSAAVRDAVHAWQQERLAQMLPGIFERYEALLGVHASRWRLRRMTSRWGSCNVRTGAITINAALAERSLPCLETVVAHELCHLLEPSHNARFHALLDEACPQNRTCQAQLNEEPPPPMA